MRVSREQAAENRERILHTAARLFREKGFDGVSVAELMKSAGLTHGGFYGHFSTKEDLMAQACVRAVDEILSAAAQRGTSGTESRFTGFIRNYLSLEHRDNPGAGCLMAALGTDAARQSPVVRSAFTRGLKRLLEALIQIVPETQTPPHAREKHTRALSVLAALVGAQVIARAVNDGELSAAVLEAVGAELRLEGLPPDSDQRSPETTSK